MLGKYAFQLDNIARYIRFYQRKKILDKFYKKWHTQNLHEYL
ncbi:hypothetical protein P788_2810 [Enterococcus faecalis MTUP9]|jgi:hypothetical protein|nr:hypothetical protein P788_2810 [Enterococcus faecalis MTUP9]